MKEQIKPGKVLIKEAEARGISIGEENNLKNNIEILVKRLRIQNDNLTMEEALEQARIILTESV